MIVKLLIEHHLEFLSLKGGFTGSSEPTLVKMSHFWKSHATAQLRNICRTVSMSSFEHPKQILKPTVIKKKI